MRLLRVVVCSVMLYVAYVFLSTLFLELRLPLFLAQVAAPFLVGFVAGLLWGRKGRSVVVYGVILFYTVSVVLAVSAPRPFAPLGPGVARGVGRAALLLIVSGLNAVMAAVLAHAGAVVGEELR